MRIAWLSNFRPFDVGTPEHQKYLLSGQFVGGAEMTDAELRLGAPEGLDFDLLVTSEWEQALDADKIIITTSDLDDNAMIRLAQERPLVLFHHLQKPTAGRRYLVEKASHVVVHTPEHAVKESSWTDRKDWELILSPINPEECWRETEKLERATWAARLHTLKGPLRARFWAASNGIPLDFLTNVPRQTVLEHMARNRYWVFLPLEWGSESRGTIEAVLSGCDCILNSNVSLMSYERWNDRAWLAEQVSTASARFWQCALS